MTAINITKKYFGEFLRYTPLKLGGMNLNGIIQFENIEDEKTFDANLGFTRTTLCKISDASEIRAGVVFNFAWYNGIVEVQILKPKSRQESAKLNFNYEFEFKDIDSFLRNLDDYDKVYARFDDLVDLLSIRPAK
jgi:hypothetical protein